MLIVGNLSPNFIFSKGIKMSKKFVVNRHNNPNQ